MDDFDDLQPATIEAMVTARLELQMARDLVEKEWRGWDDEDDDEDEEGEDEPTAPLVVSPDSASSAEEARSVAALRLPDVDLDVTSPSPPRPVLTPCLHPIRQLRYDVPEVAPPDDPDRRQLRETLSSMVESVERLVKNVDWDRYRDEHYGGGYPDTCLPLPAPPPPPRPPPAVQYRPPSPSSPPLQPTGQQRRKVLLLHRQGPVHPPVVQQHLRGCHVEKVVVTTHIEPAATPPAPASPAPPPPPPPAPQPDLPTASELLTRRLEVVEGRLQAERAGLSAPPPPPAPSPPPAGAAAPEHAPVSNLSPSPSPSPLPSPSQIPRGSAEARRSRSPPQTSPMVRPSSPRPSPRTSPRVSPRPTPRSRPATPRSRSRSPQDDLSDHRSEVPRCATVPTASSRAKARNGHHHNHIHTSHGLECFDPGHPAKKPPFRPTSVSPRRKPLRRPKHHAHAHHPRDPTSYLAPTAASLGKIRGRGYTTSTSTSTAPDPSIALFHEKAEMALRSIVRRGGPLE